MDSDIILRYPKVFFYNQNLLSYPHTKKQLKFDTLGPTLFFIIFNSKNRLVWLMMSSMLSLFFFEALEKLDLEVLDFWLFTELSILEWFST